MFLGFLLKNEKGGGEGRREGERETYHVQNGSFVFCFLGFFLSVKGIVSLTKIKEYHRQQRFQLKSINISICFCLHM